MTGSAPILEMKDISKTFPGVKALTNVSLTVYPGEIHALMGENGAGKSTLMKILSGAYQSGPGGEIRRALSLCILDHAQCHVDVAAGRVRIRADDVRLLDQRFCIPYAQPLRAALSYHRVDRRRAAAWRSSKS